MWKKEIKMEVGDSEFKEMIKSGQEIEFVGVRGMDLGLDYENNSDINKSYKIVSNKSYKIVQKEVSDLRDIGWELYKGIVVTPCNSVVIYTQVLVFNISLSVH
jgi:hypothetical protein